MCWLHGLLRYLPLQKACPHTNCLCYIAIICNAIRWLNPSNPPVCKSQTTTNLQLQLICSSDVLKSTS